MTTRLPLELIDAIFDKIEDDKTLNAALRSCRYLFRSHNPRLYLLNDENWQANVPLEGQVLHACDWASQHGQLGTLKTAHDAGIDIFDLQRLRWTTEGGHMTAFLYLLEQQNDSALDINSCFPDRATLLECAVLSGDLEMVKQLVARGATIQFDPNKETAFHLSVRHRHGDIARYLLVQGMDASIRGPHDITALHIAADVGDTDTVAWLLASGVAVDSRYSKTPSKDFTALYDAEEGGHVDTIRVLLDHGADPTSTPYGGLTALHVAACNGHMEAAGILLDHGADINAVTSCGKTPLLDAIENNHLSMIELLVGRGADMSSPSLHKPALAVAVAENLVEATTLLLEKGG